MYVTAVEAEKIERFCERHPGLPRVGRVDLCFVPPSPLRAASTSTFATKHQFRFVPDCPGKAPAGEYPVPAFPAARGLCGNGRKAKAGGIYG
jgi:hypothetical protein